MSNSNITKILWLVQVDGFYRNEYSNDYLEYLWIRPEALPNEGQRKTNLEIMKRSANQFIM
ncbi:MAG TPA: hypothetical protein VD815_08540 [Candidatus Saccharimonadales bacterium]|nr:hypothetical protein [Candidatus Saccharimonadales bacterium]